MSIRKVFFWMHLTAGSLAGIVIFIMCVTGVLLAFERQITDWSERDVRHVAVPSGARRLPLEAMLPLALANESASPTNIAWHPERDSSVEIGFGRDRTIFINPYNGGRLGEGSRRLRAFFANVEGWHRWLGANINARPAFRNITAAANLLFLFLACSGLYLWWPRTWTKSSLTTSLTLRGELKGRPRKFNQHNAIGFWSSIPLIILVSCSVVMSYRWANDLVYKAGGTPVPPPNAQARPNEPRQGKQKPLDLSGLNALSARAENKKPDWRSINLKIPSANEQSAQFTIDSGNGGQPDKRSQLTLNRESGDELKWEPFSSNPRGRRWRIMMRFTHTGEAFGLFGQTIAALASLGGAFLVYTGITLAIRRFLAWRDRSKES